MKKTTKYSKYADARAARSTLLPDCLRAFLVGGLICCIGQAFTELYTLAGIGEENVKSLVPSTLILLTAFLTGIGVFDNIVKFGGAGALVPITGFANAVASPAIDCKTEGYVLGLGAKIFTIAGPVILYGTTASVIWGVIYWLIKVL